MSRFFHRRPQTEVRERLEMLLGYDTGTWILSGDDTTVRATELDELDRLLETALKKRWSQGPIEVHMRTDNSMIPEWMRPYMGHYFNRILQLPLQY